MPSWTGCRPTTEPGDFARPMMPMPDTPAERIRRHLPVTRVPSLPDLRLHLAGPHSGLGRLLASNPGAGSPYWAHVWGGGLVLVRYLFDHPATVAGLRVLDLGCGSGLVAIAAARCGASHVTAVDVDPYAIVATALNAALNTVAVEVRCADLLDGPVPQADLVLVGDLFYEAALARRVAGFLDHCVAAGCPVLVGDPGRKPLPRERLEEIHAYPTPDFGTGGGLVQSAVYRFGRR